MQKTRAMLLVEAQNGGADIRDILADAYARHGTSQAVAEAVGITYPTLIDWLDAFEAKREQIRSYRTVVTFPEEPVGISS